MLETWVVQNWQCIHQMHPLLVFLFSHIYLFFFSLPVCLSCDWFLTVLERQKGPEFYPHEFSSHACLSSSSLLSSHPYFPFVSLFIPCILVGNSHLLLLFLFLWFIRYFFCFASVRSSRMRGHLHPLESPFTWIHRTKSQQEICFDTWWIKERKSLSRNTSKK